MSRVVDRVGGPQGNGAGFARMTRQARRQQIVRIAMRLFSQHGFRGTTTKEIAQAAGVSEAIIFRHFATKEELYAAILDHKACAGTVSSIQAAVRQFGEHGDDRAFFEAVALEMLRHHEQDTEFTRLLLHSALEGHQLFQMFWDRNVREMAEFLHVYISERQKSGALRSTIEPMVVARAFTGMVNHHALVNLLFDKSRILLDIPNERAAREFTEILLQGIAGQQIETERGEPEKRISASRAKHHRKKKK